MTAKGKAKLVRVVAIQKIALKFIGRNAAGHRLNDGPEVMKYEDAAFLMRFPARPGAGRITPEVQSRPTLSCLTTFRSGD